MSRSIRHDTIAEFNAWSQKLSIGLQLNVAHEPEAKTNSSVPLIHYKFRSVNAVRNVGVTYHK